MRSPRRIRAAICATCGRPTPVGRRGPLPRRCVPCRRRPILPERAAGRASCSTCGAEVPVPGRRGRLPTRCPPCRRENKNSGRRLLADFTPYTADELAALVSKGFWSR